jgi:inhibitor of KinA
MIPVCCEEKYELDFDRLSKKLDLTKEEIIKLYFDKEYFCYMTGFIAGMPFLGDVNKKIRCDRLETPRVKVPQGSVGITEQFANIYTFESPGGWNIIGNTPKKIFQKSNLLDPALIKPGDKVVFYQISRDEYSKFND